VEIIKTGEQKSRTLSFNSPILEYSDEWLSELSCWISLYFRFHTQLFWIPGLTLAKLLELHHFMLCYESRYLLTRTTA
jgi:hypothetical protein